jgi:hypothetical protein
VEFDLIEDSVIEAIVGDDFDRLKRYRASWDIYEAQIKKPLKVEDDAPDDNVLIPILRNFVIKSRSFLMGKPYAVELGSSDQNPPELRDSDEDRWLSELMRRNKWSSLGLQQATNGGVTGDVFMKFQPDADNAQSLDHRFICLDPSNVTPVWEPDDYTDIWLWRIRTNTVNRDGRPVIREQQWQRDDSRTFWTHATFEADLSQTDVDKKGRYVPTKGRRFQWRQIAEPKRWEYEWAPFFHWQNLVAPNVYWGESDISAAVENLASALIRLASNTNKTIRHFAHPKTVALGIDIDEWDNAIGKPLVSENEDAKVFNLEMQSDLQATLDFLNLLLDQLHEAARIPRVASGKVDNIGQLSGLALKILYGPLLELTSDKSVTYGDGNAEMLRRSLEFRKQGSMDSTFIVIQWPDPLPTDEKAEAETAVKQQEAGASKRTTLERIGFNPDTEFENAADEDEMSPDTLGLVQRLGEQQPEELEPPDDE